MFHNRPPSLAGSVCGAAVFQHSLLPPASAGDVHVAATLQPQLLHPSSEPLDEHLRSPVQEACSDVANLIGHTIRQLEDPKLRYLTLTSPIKGSSRQPPVITTVISPIKTHFTDLLASPKMDWENTLIEALQSLALHEAHSKGVITGLQSSVLLQQAYIERIHGQLEAKEKRGSKEKGHLRGDMLG